LQSAELKARENRESKFNYCFFVQKINFLALLKLATCEVEAGLFRRCVRRGEVGVAGALFCSADELSSPCCSVEMVSLKTLSWDNSASLLTLVSNTAFFLKTAI